MVAAPVALSNLVFCLSYPHSVCPILISRLALRRWSKLPCTYVSLSGQGQETTQRAGPHSKAVRPSQFGPARLTLYQRSLTALRLQ